LRKGRTTLVIAHRFSTVRDAYLIVARAEGRAQEGGTHAELLDQDGPYASSGAKSEPAQRVITEGGP
jgi:subfamily B ATP-binding cassette protein MsbA